MPDIRTNLARLLSPTTLAVVGANEQLGMSNNAVLPMLEAGREVALVNPRRDVLYGQPVFADLTAIGRPVDAVLSLVNAERAVDLVEEAAALGCGGVVIAAGGFVEAGDDGASLQARLVEVAHRTGIAVIGPNCAGFKNVPLGVNLFTGGRLDLPAAGTARRRGRRRLAERLPRALGAGRGGGARARGVDRRVVGQRGRLRPRRPRRGARRRPVHIGDLPGHRDRAPPGGVLRGRRRGPRRRQAGDRPQARALRPCTPDHAVAHRRDRRRELDLRPRVPRARRHPGSRRRRSARPRPALRAAPARPPPPDPLDRHDHHLRRRGRARHRHRRRGRRTAAAAAGDRGVGARAGAGRHRQPARPHRLRDVEGRA